MYFVDRVVDRLPVIILLPAQSARGENGFGPHIEELF